MRSLLAVSLVVALVACKPEAPRTSDPPVPSAPPSTPTATASASALPTASAVPTASVSVASAATPYDTTCRADDDCAPAPGCCPVPCTSMVVNVKELPRIQASLASCDRSMPCPSAGGCRTHAYLCNGGRCALVYAGDKGYRERR